MQERKGIPSLIKSIDLTLSGDLLYSNAKFSWKWRFFLNRYPCPGARMRIESQCERDKRGTARRGSLIVARFNDVEHYGALLSLFLSYTSHASYMATLPPAIIDDIFFYPDGIRGTVIVGNDCADLNLSRSRYLLLLSSYTWWYRLFNQSTSRDRTGLHFFFKHPIVTKRVGWILEKERVKLRDRKLRFAERDKLII